ncbi:MAG: MFS transporter, partial [Bacteroidales bacterium]|nr:MFS transporter [Bacteroidales bacterium]
MGERFGYYIMNAVLLLFICSKFGIPDATAGFIYAVFYCCIYLFSLPGGIVADRLQNYKGTIMFGLLIMALGYVLLSLPVFGGAPGHVPSWVLVFTCVALFLIAAGNGLFKGNLQAIVGQMYDNFEADAAKKGPEALALAKSKRDSGFQIFYVFINIGGVIAPFVAPLLREWLLGTKNLIYNSQMPALCHQYLGGNMDATAMNNLTELAAKVNLDPAIDAAAMAADPAAMTAFCENYLQVFNT